MFSNLFYLICAASFGMLLGLERAIRHKHASLRTFSLVSLASCLFTLLSHLEGTDHTRIAAQVVTGVGFLGTGIVFKYKDEDKIEGITTAAMIWVAAALGMACGFKYVSLAVSVLLIYGFILILASWMHKIINDFDTKVNR